MTTISANLQAVHAQIQAALLACSRESGSVRLMAVSKTKPVEAILEAIEAGQKIFGENYLQEALPKIEALATHHLEWHFIGPLQSNKTRQVAESFDWVHSVDRVKIAQRLSEQRPTALPPLNVCLQVNISQEESKSGFTATDLYESAQIISKLPHLKLRGLMAIPAPTQDPAVQRAAFSALRKLQEELIQQGLTDLDTLSMGMSDDMAAAIAEGATIVRVGSAIFGERIKQ